MLPSNVTQLFPEVPPQPPVISADFARWSAQQAKEAIGYDAKLTARNSLTPIVVPAHWTLERTRHFAAGNLHPRPEFVATVTRISNVREKLTAKRRVARGRIAA